MASKESKVIENALEQSQAQSLLHKTQEFLSNISVEILMFLFVAPSVMGSLATENLNLEKSCRVNIGFEEKVCDAMVVRNTSGYTANQEIKVQQLVSTMLAYKTAIQGTIPLLLMIFLGPWSDRHGKRKPFILLPIFGETVSNIGYIICTYFFMDLSVEYAIFFQTIPSAVTGGWFCFFVGVYSYVGGKSKLETKTAKVGSAAMMSYSSVTIGTAVSGITFRALGFYGVYSLSIFFFCIAIIYGSIMLKDEVKSEETSPIDKHKKKAFLLDLFDLKHIASTISICFKDGPNNRKKKICGIMILVLIIVGPTKGENSVMYIFTRRKFAWDELDYSTFNTFYWIIQILGTAICLTLFIKWMKLDDATLGMIAMTSKLVGSISYGFSPTPIYFYLAAVTRLFNGSSHIAMRSIMSKLVPAEELAQTNSLFGMCEALTPLLCGPLYNFVYNKSIAYFPGTFFFVSALFHLGAFFIFLSIYLMNKMEISKEPKEEAVMSTSTLPMTPQINGVDNVNFSYSKTNETNQPENGEMKTEDST